MIKPFSTLFYTLTFILCAESKALEVEYSGAEPLSSIEISQHANFNDSLRYEKLVKGSRGSYHQILINSQH
ncbi:hypothetical protein VH86_02590 [Pantoea sp. BL1]|nr:hypothetical protein VH86_02590 [Pantoea sp. BL1]